MSSFEVWMNDPNSEETMVIAPSRISAILPISIEAEVPDGAIVMVSTWLSKDSP